MHLKADCICVCSSRCRPGRAAQKARCSGRSVCMGASSCNSHVLTACPAHHALAGQPRKQARSGKRSQTTVPSADMGVLHGCAVLMGECRASPCMKFPMQWLEPTDACASAAWVQLWIQGLCARTTNNMCWSEPAGDPRAEGDTHHVHHKHCSAQGRPTLSDARINESTTSYAEQRYTQAVHG